MAPPPIRPGPLRIVIAGGGTGGHVIPALAIGRELRDHHNADLLYIGTARGLETKLVPDAGFTLKLVRSGQLKNVSLKTRLKTLADLPQGVLQCLQHLRTFNPQVVVGVGGYASGPAILAAAILRIPTLAYEPNAVPGLTNRIAGRFTSAAAVNFPQTAHFFRNAEVTGVPVRPEIFEIPPRPVPQTSPAQLSDLNNPPIPTRNSTTQDSPTQDSQLNETLTRSSLRISSLNNSPPQPTTGPNQDPTPLRLLVTAGSQGAAIFNDLLPKIAHRLLHAFPNLTIVHQSGPRHLETTRAAYAQTLGGLVLVTVEAFLNDMPAQYAAADLILARSGSTVAELCAAARASILIPFPQAADDHQRKNAEVLADAGAAHLLLQKDATEQTLYEALHTLLTDPPRRAAMAANARALALPGALPRIASMILRLAKT